MTVLIVLDGESLPPTIIGTAHENDMKNNYCTLSVSLDFPSI